MIQSGDQIYSLESNATIRRRNEVVTVNVPNMTIAGIEIARTPRAFDVVLDDILDLETNENTSLCEVRCDAWGLELKLTLLTGTDR